jgi:hypothetical protein
MGKEKAIFKSMLVTKDGNYHKSWQPTTNLKIRRRGRPSLPLSTFFFSHHQGRFFLWDLS